MQIGDQTGHRFRAAGGIQKDRLGSRREFDRFSRLVGRDAVAAADERSSTSILATGYPVQIGHGRIGFASRRGANGLVWRRRLNDRHVSKAAHVARNSMLSMPRP